MQRILIISYFFPPCNLTASQRVYSWANLLKEKGYAPTVITRNWDIPIKSSEDVLKSTGKKNKYECNECYESIYVPYKASLRDRIYIKLAGSKLQGLSKIFTLIELFFENYSTRFIAHRNIYLEARKFLKKNPDVTKVIISANPFNLFFFGFLLKKEFNIEWIADYRDDWNTTELD
jgi:hypothetical protein